MVTSAEHKEQRVRWSKYAPTGDSHERGDPGNVFLRLERLCAYCPADDRPHAAAVQ